LSGIVSENEQCPLERTLDAACGIVLNIALNLLLMIADNFVRWTRQKMRWKNQT